MAKNFKVNTDELINPTMNFITTTDKVHKKAINESQNKINADESLPIGCKWVEKKTKKLLVMLQPSTVKELEEIAKQKGKSRNSIIEEAIKNYITTNK